MTDTRSNHADGPSSEEAKAAFERLRLAFGGGGCLEMTEEEALAELRAARDGLRDPQVLKQLSFWERAHAEELIGEVSKFFFTGGRA